MLYVVIAQAKDRATGELLAPPRPEVIDTATNEIFAHCKSTLEVLFTYEYFWNNTDPASTETVDVISISRL